MNAGERGDELAKYVVDEIEDMSSKVDRDIMTRRVLRAMEAAQLYEPPRPFVPVQMMPMSDAESRRFANAPVDLAGSAYNGGLVKNVPRWYLCGISDPTKWKRDLARWLKSTKGES